MNEKGAEHWLLRPSPLLEKIRAYAAPTTLDDFSNRLRSFGSR